MNFTLCERRRSDDVNSYRKKSLDHAMSAGKDVVMSDEEAELKKRGYEVGTALGEGSYAKVKSAFSQKLQKRVAIKIINKKKAPKDFREKFLPRELKIFALMDHQNIIKMYEVMEFHNKVSSVSLPRSRQKKNNNKNHEKST